MAAVIGGDWRQVQGTCSSPVCAKPPVLRGLCDEHLAFREKSQQLTLHEVELTDEEMEQMGRVIDVLAQHAMSYVWEPLARGQFRDTE